MVIRTFENAGGLIIGNFYGVICSSVLIFIAYLKMNDAGTHKRLLFGACIFFIGPAFDRFMRPFNLGDIHPALNFLTLLYLFPLSLIVYDIVKKHKLHPASTVILLLFILLLPFVGAAMQNDWHKYVIKFLG